MDNSFTSENNNNHALGFIEVFRTNVKNLHQANYFQSELLKIFYDLKVDFDLEDCDKILRIEGNFNYNRLFKIAVLKD